MPTLYEWAGGQAAFERLIDAFCDRVEADELISPLFGGGVGEEHRRNVTAWWTEVFGGPRRATRRSSAAMSAWSESTAGWRSRPSSGFASRRS